MRLRKQQRLILVVLALLLLGGASGLVLFALSDSVAFFVTPSDIAAGKVDPDKRFRLGGLVVAGSVEQPGNDGLVLFRVTDQAHEVPVRYRGILPDLFREDRGSSLRASSGRMACSRRARCSPSTMRTICRPRSRRR